MTDTLPSHDATQELAERIRAADASGTPLRIVGGDTKARQGRRVAGEPLATGGHRGITYYDPVELIVSVRSGTPLADLEAVLAEQGQMLGCEPPHLGDDATVGGMVATGLSGPRRPWAGSVRDFVLGTRVINREGVEQRFGGQVMKNVAGYDLSRLMVGAQGTLGLLTEVTLKVLPLPGASRSLHLDMPLAEAMEKLAEWGRKPLPITAAAWLDGALHLRLEGGPSSVATCAERLGGDALDERFWTALREQRLAFFSEDDPRPLWRLSMPHHTPTLALPTTTDSELLYDWAGTQRWLRSLLPAETIREATARAGGHATCLGHPEGQGDVEPFAPLDPVVAKYHQNLKRELDPNGIFNPGRLYAEF
ncbi:glycolate oxidase subunit GlcE [Halomonas urumqiensis]|uniref:Glycolate oxidase subunit GlcE n=1 Tax=Halomonas urumqiensis TaxID=1684789 RepID=A0A2N7UMC6_9GAMM|nr:glycolate oxidase subunit GlcE [Halomonas urumqiensis]PMR81584.1 glycolate oxidase subunit GlcE [Halomonas urumqiensis]PTB02221.1 glycolate oxidase subunit GlcE [Halomonas urumqiensis]GHE21683.1 glycolate oxidase [Halomonas urumqiensis]